MNKFHLTLLLGAAAALGLAGCKGSDSQGPPTASDKKAFLGVSDPAAQARDAAAYAAHNKVAPGGPPAGAGNAQAPPSGGAPPSAGQPASKP